MKNERLDELQDLAWEIHRTIPSIDMRRDGTFVDDDDIEVPPSSVMRRCHDAKTAANALYVAMAAEPRRKTPSKEGES